MEQTSDTIAYVYAPGTELDEPVVQTTDNSTYLDKRFDGGHEPYMGTVFMDTDNKKDFSDRLTWYLVMLVVVKLGIIVCLMM